MDAPGDRQPFIERGVCPCHSGSLYESDESDDGGAGGCENGGLGGGDKCGDSWV